MKKIVFAEQEWLLTHTGVLLWPEKDIAVVADMHLEKASYFARHGQMLPPHDSHATLQKLLTTLEPLQVKTLILLGDSFHDQQGFDRLNSHTQAIFKKLCRDYHIIWVIGNHDGSFIPPDVEGVEEIVFDRIHFRHEAEQTLTNDTFEISGHFHPKVELTINRSKVSRACFIHDKKRMILPSFGAFTGGLRVSDPAIQCLFAESYTVHLLGESKIFSVPSLKLA